MLVNDMGEPMNDSFESKVWEELQKNGYESPTYNENTLLCRRSIYGRTDDGPYLIYFDTYIMKGEKKLRFCMPETPVDVRMEDAAAYADKDLVDFLFDQDVFAYAPWPTTIAAGDRRARPPQDKMHLYLSAEDAKRHAEDPSYLLQKIEEERAKTYLRR